ncbi:RHS repeat domain-containing protein [Plantibacter sp. Mn2098]|uniref:RHS repeat domain-containing protein n=1 Tax=Plantibacter sp. Mn2098 TaxID=3395266 RepID=UPI003BE0D1CC
MTATATSIRVDGAEVTFPKIVNAVLTGAADESIELVAPGSSWAWRIDVFPSPSASVLRGVYTFDDVPVIDWADMTRIDPSTLEPLNPLPPSAAEILADASDARDTALGVAAGLPAAASGAVASEVTSQVDPKVQVAVQAASDAGTAASGAHGSAVAAEGFKVDAKTEADRAAGAATTVVASALFPAATAIEYDPSGNVTKVTENAVVTTYTYNPDGTVHTDTRAGVTRTYVYDSSGNLIRIEA